MRLEESRISLETVDPRPLASDLVVIYREAYRALPQYAYHGPREIREYLEWLWRRAPEGFLVAFAGDQAVGFLAVDYRWRTPEGEETGELHELAVHPEHQGQGIGRRLLREGIALLDRRGRRKLGLWVGAENHQARAMYRRLGFTETGTFEIWLRMERTVPPLVV